MSTPSRIEERVKQSLAADGSKIAGHGQYTRRSPRKQRRPCLMPEAVGKPVAGFRRAEPRLGRADVVYVKTKIPLTERARGANRGHVIDTIRQDVRFSTAEKIED